jgi:neutral ceramidase
MGSNQLFAGAVEINITPPVGYGFDGYAARVGNSVGIHDPLLAQLLLIKFAEQQIVLICLDLVGISLSLTRQVRTAIEQIIGVPQDCVLIACSHTHSGVSGFMPVHPGISTSEDLELQQVVARQLIGAAIWANQKLQPASLGIGRGYVQGIGLNRNDPTQQVDSAVIVLRVDTLSGQPLAVVMNYGCHPTVLGYQNLLYSADYPGAARSTLHKVYPDTTFMYTNGASGDISTRFTRRDQSFSEVERMGRILGGEVLKVMQNITTQPTLKLNARTALTELNFRSFPPSDKAQHEVERFQAELEALKAAGAAPGEIRKATTRVEGATGQAQMAKALLGRSGNKSQIQVMEIGDLALVGLPGEPFTRTVLEIKQQSPHPYTAVVSYSNDYQGYFPDAISIAEGSYEALISPYGADVAEQLRDSALDLLQRR